MYAPLSKEIMSNLAILQDIITLILSAYWVLVFVLILAIIIVTFTGGRK